MVDMCHERHADLFGDLKRDVQWRCALIPRCMAAYSNLYPDDQIAVLVGDLSAFKRCKKAEVSLSPTMILE